jgi:hypothetical protein
MYWDMFLLLIHLNATNYCEQFEHSFIQTNCVEEITRCVIDGETFIWCSENVSDLF